MQNNEILFTVTQEDIDFGKHAPDSCPVALAMHRVLQRKVAVRRVYIYINNYKYPMPKAVRRFIDAFDVRRPVEPFHFWMAI